MLAVLMAHPWPRYSLAGFFLFIPALYQPLREILNAVMGKYGLYGGVLATYARKQGFDRVLIAFYNLTV